jgi:hypothetical protein
MEQWLRNCATHDAAVSNSAAAMVVGTPGSAVLGRMDWCRRFEFYYPLRDGPAGDIESTASSSSVMRPTNCLLELYGSLAASASVDVKTSFDDAASRQLFHPIALHFGLQTFILVRFDGLASHRSSEGDVLLSLGACAAQQAGLAVAVFAPTSTDDEGKFRGVLQAPTEILPFDAVAKGVPMIRLRPLSFHCTRAHDERDGDGTRRADDMPLLIAPPAPPSRLRSNSNSMTPSPVTGAKGRELPTVTMPPVAMDDPPHCFAAHFHTNVVQLARLYHTHHGALPASTLEGLLTHFRLNAGATTKFVPAPNSDGAATMPALMATRAAITANVRLSFDIRAPEGDDWTAFVEDELNSACESAVEASAVVRGKPSAKMRLDSTTPRALFLSSPPATCGRSVPIGASVCPFRALNIGICWEGLDADSAAVVDNTSRSMFAELVGGTSSDHAATGSGGGTVGPTATTIAVDWRARSEVASVTTDRVRDVVSVVAANFGDDDGDNDSRNDDGETNADDTAAQRAKVFGADVVLPTAQRLNLHATEMLTPRAPVEAAEGTPQFFDRSDADPLVARFCNECAHLRSADEMYQLWLRLVDHLRAVVQGSTASSMSSGSYHPHHGDESFDAFVEKLIEQPKPVRLSYVAGLISGRRQGEHSSRPSRPLEGVQDLLAEKLAGLATCCRDEVEVGHTIQPATPATAAKLSQAQGLEHGAGGEEQEGWDNHDDVNVDDTVGKRQRADATKAEAGPVAREDTASSLDTCESQEGDEENKATLPVGESETKLLSPPRPTTPPPPGASVRRKLLMHPSIDVQYPPPRRRAPQTRDIVQQEAQTLMALGTTEAGQRLRQAQQAESSVLFEDMNRFIWLNTRSDEQAGGGKSRTILLADFVRWYSPKDFVAATLVAGRPPAAALQTDDLGLDYLSTRMRVEASSNAWVTTWRKAQAACAAPGAAYPPDLAYDPLVGMNMILKYLGGATAEEVGSLVASAVIAMSARRLINARVWNLNLPNAVAGAPPPAADGLPSGPGSPMAVSQTELQAATGTPLLPRLTRLALAAYRSVRKALPADTDLQSGCSSSAAWMSHYANVLSHIETLDVLTTTASAMMRMIVTTKADAFHDEAGEMMTGEKRVAAVAIGNPSPSVSASPKHAASATHPPTTTTTMEALRVRWGFIDDLIADAWTHSPWTNDTEPPSVRTEAHRRVRGLPRALLTRLQPAADRVQLVPSALWGSWLAERLFGSRRGGRYMAFLTGVDGGKPVSLPPPGSSKQAGMHPHQQLCPFCVKGVPVYVDSEVDSERVTLAMRRIELVGYAIRPLLWSDTGGGGGSPHAQDVGGVLSGQALTATIDFKAGQAHFALLTSELFR